MTKATDSKKTKAVQSKMVASSRKFRSGDEVEVEGHFGVVTDYFANSLSHVYVEIYNDPSKRRLIVPQEECVKVPKCPWRLALTALVGTSPPPWVRGDIGSSNWNDRDHQRLTDWIAENLQPSMAWSTCIGIIDAACLLVKEAKDNGNFERINEEFNVDAQDEDPR